MKVGIIGCGGIANWHKRIYTKINNITVSAVSDIDFNKAKFFADKHRIDKFYDSPIKMLEDNSFDFIDICTPPSTHSNLVKDVARSGNNILLEKPMALSTSECDTIIHEVEKHGVKLCVCHNQTAYRSVREVKSRINSGDLDPLCFKTTQRGSPELYADMTQWSRTPEEKGIIWEVGCHHAYLHQYLFDEISEVYALGSKVKYPVYDNLSVLLRTPHRARGIINISWIDQFHEINYEINGSDGNRMFIDRDTDTLITENKPYNSNLMLKNQLYRRIPAPIKKGIKKISSQNKTLKSELGYYLGHYYLIKEYINSIKKDIDPPVTPEDGKKTIKILECIEKSLETNKTISITP